MTPKLVNDQTLQGLQGEQQAVFEELKRLAGNENFAISSSMQVDDDGGLVYTVSVFQLNGRPAKLRRSEPLFSGITGQMKKIAQHFCRA